jgi:diguanylate cyclase (GGDEF)-like protein
MSDDKTKVQRSPFADSVAGQPEDDDVRAHLIVLSGDAVGRMFTLQDQECVVGRGKESHIRLTDDGISRAHAKVVRHADGTMEVIDLGSTNGTYLNGERVTSCQLKDGDRILIGPVTILKFSYQDGLEEKFQQQLYESATRDSLTGAHNRRYFFDTLDKDFSHAARHGSPLSLVLFDLDRFKRINDTMGHAAGDEALRQIAQAVTRAVRKDDLFCRIGGEEFAVLVRDTAERNACLFAERLRALVESLAIEFEGHEIRVTISLGVATLKPALHAEPRALVADADRYLYQAKNRGRNRVEAAILSG